MNLLLHSKERRSLTILSDSIRFGGQFSTTTLRATSSSVLARVIRKSPDSTTQSSLGSNVFGSALFSSGKNSPHDTALTLSTPHESPTRACPSQLGLQPAPLFSTNVLSRIHSQFSGKSKGCSSIPIVASIFSFFILPSKTSFAFSACMRLSNSLAGSSLASCTTSFPMTASCSKVCLRASMLASVVNKVSKCAAIRCQLALKSAALCDCVSVPSRWLTSCWCASAASLCWASSWSHRAISSSTLPTMRACSLIGGTAKKHSFRTL